MDSLTFEEEVESLHSSPLLISAACGRAASEPMASTALGFCRLCATYTCTHPELAHSLTAAMHASHNVRAILSHRAQKWTTFLRPEKKRRAESIR